MTTPPSFLLTKAPPITIYTSPKETKEESWGFVQFPTLTHLHDGAMLLSFQVALDSAKSYGTGNHKHFISRDNGNSWQEISEQERTTQLAYPGISVDKDTHLSIETLKANEIKDISLPSHFTWMPCDYTYSQPEKAYLFHTLPEFMQTIAIRRTNPHTNSSVVSLSPITLEGDFRMAGEDLLPVTFFGSLKQLSDKSLVGVFYPSFAQSKEGTPGTKDGVLLVHSRDLGKTWQQLDRLPYLPDLHYDKKGNLRGGFTEPNAELLDDGSLLIAMRTADATPEPFPGLTEFGPLYIVKRSKEGIWSTPKPVSPFGVMPQLLKLKNGTLVLSYGRPGIQVRFSTDEGDSWSAPIDILEATRLDPRAETCGYSSLIEDPHDPNSFWIAYSQFLTPDSQHNTHKAILVQHCRLSGVIAFPEHDSETAEEPDDLLEHYYEGGEDLLAVRIRLFQGKPHGLTEGFYETGSPSFTTPYRKGVVHGVQRFYAPEGYLIRTMPFHNGMRHGITRFYDKLGNILRERFIWEDKLCSREEFIAYVQKEA